MSDDVGQEVRADNVVLPFQVGDGAVRGRVVRLSAVVHEILEAHQDPDAVSVLVGEAACLVSLMGSSLKFTGKLIFQAQGNGPVSLVVADYTVGGAVRAMAKVQTDPEQVSGVSLLGAGQVVMTIDQGPDMERYQGVTPIEGNHLGEAAMSYFEQSEQIPTVIKLAVGKISAPGQSETWRAGGIIVQFVPDEGGDRERGEEFAMDEEAKEEWERAAAFVHTTQDDELIDPSISADTLLYRLFHEDGVRVFEPEAVSAKCSCNGEKIAAVLGRYTEQDLKDMVENDIITVTCEFCCKNYIFTPDGQPAAAP